MPPEKNNNAPDHLEFDFDNPEKGKDEREKENPVTGGTSPPGEQDDPRIIISETDEFASEAMQETGNALADSDSAAEQPAEELAASVPVPASDEPPAKPAVQTGSQPGFSEPVTRPLSSFFSDPHQSVLKRPSGAPSPKPDAGKRPGDFPGKIKPEKRTATPESDPVAPRTAKSEDISQSIPRNNPMATTPLTNYTKNIDRQKKEQRAVNTILSGVGLFFLSLILIFAASSGFGGYILWKQIQNQAVTVAQLDDKYNKHVIALTDELVRVRENLDATTAVVSQQKEQIAELKRNLAAAERRMKVDRAVNQAAIAQLQQQVRALEQGWRRR